MLDTNEFIKRNWIIAVLTFVVGGCVMLATNPVACQAISTNYNNFIKFVRGSSAQTKEAVREGADVVGDAKKRMDTKKGQSKKDTTNDR
jgi:hypothetical protein